VAQAETCPNEQLRVEDHSTTLPDCRAYELVSPPFADGEPVGTEDKVVAANGSGIVLNSVGGFGGAEEDGKLGSRYLATRTSSGWSALPVDPSAAQFGTQELADNSSQRTVDFNRELTQALFVATPAGSPLVDLRFYNEQLTPGLPFTEIGPAFSPVRVAEWTGEPIPGAHKTEWPGNYLLGVGASADLSHVFVEFKAGGSLLDWNWPGVGAAKSLYEYSGTGNSEPYLVGVKPGTGEAESRPAEHPQLISQCGALLGGLSSAGSVDHADDTYNAIADGGSRVFFTALQEGDGCEGPAVDEVYTRTDGSVTTAISEPSKADCRECDTEAAAQSNAYFQGANEAGSKVFFLSEQKLFAGRQGEAGTNLYEFDFEAPEGERVSLIAPQTAGEKGSCSSCTEQPGGVMGVSENGKFVYLVSEDDELASNADALGKTPKQTVEAEEAAGKHTHNLMYLLNTTVSPRQFTFVAGLAQSDQEDWSTEYSGRRVEATPDGRFLLFGSAGDLTPGAEGTGSQLYRFDAEPTTQEEADGVPRLVRVSIGREGYNHNGNTGVKDEMNNDTPEGGGAERAEPQAVSITSDGTRVFFSSEAALVSGALNNACVYVNGEGECTYAINVYEWEQAGIGSGAGGCPQSQTAGCVYLISPPDDHVVLNGSTVALIGADATGENVFFKTADDLVGQDTSGQQAVYDARVDGGFPAPVTPPACSEEACQVQTPPPPSLTTPASATFTGPGNLVQPAPAVPAPKKTTKTVKCKKPKKLSHGKCVKPKAKKSSKKKGN
jgi:hypothetical protein